ncbi:MAG: enoyl-CoA hydratase-related protein, partial [Burkholderiaceae bacterium]
MSSAAVKPADFEPGNAELLGWEQYGDVAVLRMNEPERRINLFDAGLVDALTRAVARVRAEPGVRGAVLISAKSSGFLRGADFDRLFEQMLAGLPLEAAAGRFAREHALMRAIEAGGKPFVAAINGHVLGGGLELCLSCHGRLVADDPSIRFGLPEVSLGLIPACGGTQRLPRLIGIPAALSMIVDGRKLAPRDALAARLVDAVVPPDELLGKAIEWVRAHADAQQPWDQRGYRVPGGAGALAPHASQAFYIGMARLRARTHDNYPAPAAAQRAVYEGTQLPHDRGLAVEAECFAQLFCHPTAAHLLRTFFIQRGRTRSPAPAQVE